MLEGLLPGSAIGDCRDGVHRPEFPHIAENAMRFHGRHDPPDEDLNLRRLLFRILESQRHIMSALSDLQGEVARIHGAIPSAIALLKGLHDKLNEIIVNGNNDPALVDLTQSLRSDTDSLAAGVAANPLPSDQPDQGDQGNTDQGADTGDTTGQPGEPA
jgi:hypothetical protein